MNGRKNSFDNNFGVQNGFVSSCKKIAINSSGQKECASLGRPEKIREARTQPKDSRCDKTLAARQVEKINSIK